jgi:hypothetical protein
MQALPILPGFALLWIGVAVFVFLVLLLSRPRTRPIGLALTLAVVLGGLLLVFISVPRHVASRDFAPETEAGYTYSPTVPALWSEGADRRFDADVYPSRELAARALGISIGTSIVGTGHGDKPLVIHTTEAEIPVALLADFREGIQHAASDLTINSLTSQTRQVPVADSNHLELSLFIRERPQGPTSRETPVRPQPWQGEVTAVLADPSHTWTWKVPFREVPWLTHTAVYLNQPGQQQRVIVYSRESCGTAAEARQQALQQARQYIQTRINTEPGSHFSVTSAELNRYDIIHDSFVQSLDGTAGRIWRQALLLDASPEKIAALKQTKQATVVIVRKTWFSMLASAAGLGLIILILYIFLNAATRGYYTWSLRVAAVVVTGVILAAIFLLNRPM